MKRIRLAEQEAGVAADEDAAAAAPDGAAPGGGATAQAVGRRVRATTLQGGTLK